MKQYKYLFSPVILFFTLILFLQPVLCQVEASSPTPDAAGAVAGAGCCGSMIFITMLPFIILALNIGLMIYVAKDARARGMEGAVWIILMLVLGVIGFLIYECAKTKGTLVTCKNCRNQRLMGSKSCPHCGDTLD